MLKSIHICIIAAGLTLIGATTYFVATRYIRKKRSSKEHGRSGSAEDSCEDDLMSDDDDLNYRLSNDRKRRGLQRRSPGVVRPPPLITFAELFEQALLLHQHRNSQRNVKIYFDSNDEYVREE